MRTITIGPNDAGQRLDKFMQKLIPDMPKGLMYKLIRKKRIKYNGARCKGMEQLQSGDTLTLYISDEFFSAAKKPDFYKAAGRPDIVYEDSNILVVNKPVGVSAHSEKPGVPNMQDIALAYLIKTGAHSPDKEQSFTPSFANRLDRNTQGMMVMGKNAAALRELNALIAAGKTKKTYLCQTEKVPVPEEGILHGYIVKDKASNVSKIVSSPTADSKEVITGYKVIERQKDMVTLQIDLITGRSHQIRAHMASIGCPLLGDKKYGGKPVYKYQALCAVSLTFCADGDSPLAYLNDKTFTVKPWFIK